ncbi:MAG TPA: glycoside hydrolase family 3 N-terminal domain-containing protein [Terriglobales bacterium]|nr:glycoside hydrolase family 3 N-terminal domain-containing protein [Terriglobales bacterium]
MRHTLLSIGLILSAFLLGFAKDKKDSPKSHPLAPIHLDRDGEKWAEKTLRKLSVEEKVGQLFMIWVRAQFLNVDSPDYLQLREDIHKYHIGSFCMTVPYDPPFLHRSEPYEAAALLNGLQQESKLPLLVAADFERGITMRLSGGTVFPAAMSFGAAGKLDYAEAFGRISAQESRAIGVHWNFFPDADVNSNPANPIINTRSFGEDPQQVGDFVSAYIRGARANGMLTTVKHFPGHGDTATDSHLSVAQVTGDMARLQAVELRPFRQAIEAGVDSVMVAHVTAPALDPDPNHVATVSPAIVTGLLKNQLGFKGIVVTDALDMAGVTSLYSANIGRAAVDAFKAGNDVLLIPADLDASYRAVLEAVRSGEISQAQLDASVLKLLKAKASLGLQKTRLVDLNTLPTTIGKPENVALGQQISDDAVTVVRDNGKILPLKKEGTIATGLPYQKVQEVRDRVVVVVFSEDVRTDSGRTLDHQIRSRIPDAHVIYIDPRIAGAMSSEVLSAVDQAQAVVAAIYMVPTAGKAVKVENGTIKNSIGLADASGSLLQTILDRAAEKTTVLAMGNPYLAQDFPSVQNYICTFSNASVSEISAAKALFGEIPIRGHLPVSIPNIAQRGSGMDRPQQIVQGDSQHAHSQITRHEN